MSSNILNAFENIDVFGHPSCLWEMKVSSDNSVAFEKLYARMTLPHECRGCSNRVVDHLSLNSSKMCHTCGVLGIDGLCFGGWPGAPATCSVRGGLKPVETFANWCVVYILCLLNAWEKSNPKVILELGKDGYFSNLDRHMPGVRLGEGSSQIPKRNSGRVLSSKGHLCIANGRGREDWEFKQRLT
ncbi:unnamed protein product [Prunus armeniaca]